MEVDNFIDFALVNSHETQIYADSKKGLSLCISEGKMSEDVVLFLKEKDKQIDNAPVKYCDLLGLYIATGFNKIPEAIDSLIQALNKRNYYCIRYDAMEILKYQIHNKILAGRLLGATEICKCFSNAQCQVNDEEILLFPIRK